jgi:hypothetical protein
MNFAIKVLFKIYNFISTAFEKSVLLKENKNSSFLEMGFEFIKLNTDHHLQNYIEKKVSVNQYFERLILKKSSIKEILKLIFCHKIINVII